MNESWKAVTVLCPQQAEELVSAVLRECVVDGLSIEARDDLSAITAYFPAEIPLPQILSEVTDRIAALADHLDVSQVIIKSDTITQSDWADEWKKYYFPTRISRYLTVLPAWDQHYQTQQGEMVIRLDPGLSFGTGTHPTTVLAIHALEQTMRGGEEVIDIGTGSGVLTIAASLLGAQKVLALDIDDQAVAIAQQNIELNHIRANIEVRANNLLAGVKEMADIIVANILAEVLSQLIDDAAALLKPGGHLVLSGIYQDKVDSIIGQVTRTGLTVVTEMKHGDWNCLIATKRLGEEPTG